MNRKVAKPVITSKREGERADSIGSSSGSSYHNKSQKNDLKMALSSWEILQMSPWTKVTDLDWTI